MCCRSSDGEEPLDGQYVFGPENIFGQRLLAVSFLDQLSECLSAQLLELVEW